MVGGADAPSPFDIGEQMLKDLTGQIFGKVTVLGRAAANPKRRGAYWHTRCACGVEKVQRGDLVQKAVMCMKCAGKKNGDRWRGKTRPCLTKHGSVETRLYGIWHGMKTRAKGTGNQYQRVKYKHVDLFNEWLDFVPFKEWAMTNGYTDVLTIDRIDNAKGYHPDNCKWATHAEQSQNRTVCKFNAESVIEIRKLYTDGKTLTELARKFDSDASTILKIVSGKTWKNIEQPHSWAQKGV